VWYQRDDFIWNSLVAFAIIAYLIIMFNILIDLFWRDHKTSGWIKAVWMFFLVAVPYITALVYVIARGRGMSERAHGAAVAAKRERDIYIREAAGHSPAKEIAHAKALLEAGTISQQEFDELKAKALG
jgi:hypothetical protein